MRQEETLSNLTAVDQEHVYDHSDGVDVGFDIPGRGVAAVVFTANSSVSGGGLDVYYVVTPKTDRTGNGEVSANSHRTAPQVNVEVLDQHLCPVPTSETLPLVLDPTLSYSLQDYLQHHLSLPPVPPHFEAPHLNPLLIFPEPIGPPLVVHPEDQIDIEVGPTLRRRRRGRFHPGHRDTVQGERES